MEILFTGFIQHTLKYRRKKLLLFSYKIAAREPIFKMTFLKSTFSSKLISCEMGDLEQKTKEIQYLLAMEVHRVFF